MTKDEIINQLNKFVETRGKGCYGYETPILPPSPDLNPVYGRGKTYENALQQSRNEIYQLVDVILKLDNRKVILETGGGEWLGTHFLWRMMFEKIITIEHVQSIVDQISYETDERDVFIIRNTCDPQTVEIVKQMANTVDALFLDSNHDYNTVLTEFNYYSNLVREGGLVIFHDSLSRVNEAVNVLEFLEDLRNGKIDGKFYEIFTIDDSPGPKVGISYFYKS